jgi:hypothetical protein
MLSIIKPNATALSTFSASSQVTALVIVFCWAEVIFEIPPTFTDK